MVLNIGSSAEVDFDAAAEALDTDWSAVGKGLYRTVSNQVDAYAVNPEAASAIADKISELADDAQLAIDALIATIPEDTAEEME